MSRPIEIFAKQGTNEWHAIRKKKIGASEASICLGINPWKSAYELFFDKLSLEIDRTDSPAMARGRALEPFARAAFSLETGIEVEPKTYQHGSIDYMMASLDGISSDMKNIVEIKCPGAEDHYLALQGQIPLKYVPQLQHQLEVCQCDKVFYYSFDGEKGVVVEVFRDDKYIKEMLLRESEFWECLQSCTPPPMTEKDYVLIDNQEWKHATEEWIATKKLLNSIELKEKEWKEKLLSLAQNRNAKGNGVAVQKVIRKGSIDYSSITALQELDLELYRKPPIEYFKIGECKN